MKDEGNADDGENVAADVPDSEPPGSAAAAPHEVPECDVVGSPDAPDCETPDAQKLGATKLFRLKRLKLYSANIRMFLAIIVHDCIGAPRVASGMKYDAFAKRRIHNVDTHGLEFCQGFLNKIACDLHDRLTFKLPGNFRVMPVFSSFLGVVMVVVLRSMGLESSLSLAP